MRLLYIDIKKSTHVIYNNYYKRVNFKPVLISSILLLFSVSVLKSYRLMSQVNFLNLHPTL